MLLLGYDLGSSSIKAALVDSEINKVVAVAQYPDLEMPVLSKKSGWAEQSPQLWWECTKNVTAKLLALQKIDLNRIGAIGIAYQMHGLVLVDKKFSTLRDAIIWCDSRALPIGQAEFDKIGHSKCFSHLLNSPGNFTVSKLKWVKDNEPKIYDKIFKALLPGDFLSLKMTGKCLTTISGLSEAILWDFKEKQRADFLLNHFGIANQLIPEHTTSVGFHGELTKEASDWLGLRPGIPVTYKAGDQPNNAGSLNGLEPGEIVASGGTSGVVYGIVEKPIFDKRQRVNSFAHINYTNEKPRIGVLLCINGAGIQYRWVRDLLASGHAYNEIENIAATVSINSEGLQIFPFGNGIERMLENKNVGSNIMNLNFNRHNKATIYRATLEGLAFSFVYGIKILEEIGLKISAIKVDNSNLFQSEIFSNTIASCFGREIVVMDTSGAVGAARISGVATKAFSNIEEALRDIPIVKIYQPQKTDEYEAGYLLWENNLNKLLASHS